MIFVFLGKGTFTPSAPLFHYIFYLFFIFLHAFTSWWMHKAASDAMEFKILHLIPSVWYVTGRYCATAALQLLELSLN